MTLNSFSHEHFI